MGSHVGVIRLNGQAYDAKTGQPVSVAQKNTHHKSGRSVDGFFKASSHAQPKLTARSNSTGSSKHASPRHHTPAQHTVHHKQQRSKTLMRQAVSRPSMPMQTVDTVQQAPVPMPETPKNDRLKRAMEVKKSSQISKFSPGQHSSIEKKFTALSVKPEPEAVSNQASSLTHKSVAQAPAAPLQTHAQSKAEEHFNRALAKAEAHKEHAPKAKRRHRAARRVGISSKALNIAAGTLAIVILAGFFAYQNIPNISMRIAAARAGFSAKLPGYQPSGFAMGGPIDYSPGSITVNFASNSDDRQYAISQQVSGWNSEALVDNYLAPNNKEYQTYQDKGRTIYLYDTNATWVSGGVWYKIDGNGVLNNEQLIRVANSL